MNKEQLIQEIAKIVENDGGSIDYITEELLANFIISREQSILERVKKPLKDVQKEPITNWKASVEAIDEALSIISQIEEGK